MSGIRRYRRKPDKPSEHDVMTAAPYVPGEPLDDLAAVAKLAYQGQIAECALPSGPVLVASWLDIPDDHPSKTQYEVIEPGHWLCHSGTYDSLTSSTASSIAHWYEDAP